jgi:hypothetical protein
LLNDRDSRLRIPPGGLIGKIRLDQHGELRSPPSPRAVAKPAEGRLDGKRQGDAQDQEEKGSEASPTAFVEAPRGPQIDGEEEAPDEAEGTKKGRRGGWAGFSVALIR